MKMWIARDVTKALWLYESEPICGDDGRFFPKHFENCKQLLDDAFPKVTFENSPMEVELVIKN